MKRMIPILLLVLGVAIAGAAGARNGPSHTAYRAEVAAGVEGLTPPPPRQRLEEWARVAGLGWALGLSLIVVGAVLARRQLAAEHAGGADGSGGVDLRGALVAVTAELQRLTEEIEDLPFDDDAPATRAAIDRLVDAHLTPVIEQRGQLIARHGLTTFAGYFGLFSAGERKLARCWSALTDGHPVVAREALDEARSAFAAALAAYEKAEGPAGV